jgi:hypothetical protein
MKAIMPLGGMQADLAQFDRTVSPRDDQALPEWATHAAV